MFLKFLTVEDCPTVALTVSVANGEDVTVKILYIRENKWLSLTTKEGISLKQQMSCHRKVVPYHHLVEETQTTAQCNKLLGFHHIVFLFSFFTHFRVLPWKMAMD